MPPSDHEIEREIAAFVSRTGALDFVRELAALGPRTGGTSRGDRAAMLIAGRMRDLGLTVEILDDPPTEVHESLAWRLAIDGKSLDSAHPWINAPSLAEAQFPLVSDQGEGAAPPGDGTLRGAAVLTSRGPAAHRRFFAAGAAMILTDFPAAEDRYIDWAFIGEQEEGSTIPVFGLSLNDANRLREALRIAGTPHIAASLTTRNTTGHPRTVIGSIEGSGSDVRRTIVVCAHGDADGGGPGADDNASGVAAVVEVARALARASREGMLPQDRPRVLFIIWGKEYHSSEAWVRANDETMAGLAAAINYDQVGTGARRNALYYEGNDIAANEVLLRTIEAVAVAHAGSNGFWGVHTSCPSMGGTDAFAFLSRRRGGTADHEREIAATTVFTAAWDRPKRMTQTPGWESPGWPKGEDIVIDYSPYYHSAGDTPANTTDVEPHNIENAARLVALTIRRLMRASPGT